MARTKKNTVQEEVLEQEVETKEEQKVEKQTTAEDLLEGLKAKAAQEALDKAKQRESMTKLYCKKDTPYLKIPNVNNNVAGIIPKGTMLYVEEVVNNYPNGKFYKIHEDMYVNTQWDFEVF